MPKKGMKALMKWLGIIGLLVAVALPLLSLIPAFPMLPWVSWVLLVAGLVIGFGFKAKVKDFVALLVLLAVSGGISVVPFVGEVVSAIFGNVLMLVGGMALVPAVRIVLKRIGVKF